MEKQVCRLLEKFFAVATTDNDYRIRSTMLKYLNPQFDRYISRYENLLMLFNCRYDYSFDIRERSIGILGRLVKHNPAQILPYLSDLLLELLNTFENSSDPKESEESAKLLKTFIESCQDLVKHNSDSILTALRRKLEQDSVTSTFVSAVLEAIGELSNVGGYAIKPYLPELFPMLLECVKD